MAISTWHNLSRRLIYIGGTKVKTMAGVGISICWSNVEYLEFVLSSWSPYSILIPSSSVVMTLSLSFCWGERDKKKNFPHWASVSPMFCKNSHIYTQECISNVGLKRRRICMYIIILLKNEENVSYYSFKKSVSSNWKIVAQVKSIHERGRPEKNCPVPVPLPRLVKCFSSLLKFLCLYASTACSLCDYFLCWTGIYIRKKVLLILKKMSCAIIERICTRRQARNGRIRGLWPCPLPRTHGTYTYI